MSLRPIRRALLSVSDKAGLVDFAKVLAGFGVELISTGGTSKTLKEAGLTGDPKADKELADHLKVQNDINLDLLSKTDLK